MILERLTLGDFRAYRGVHEIALAPRVRRGAERPIVLFGGLNGAGKTTLLMAVKLALYGRHALGTGTTQTDYQKFLRDSIHSAPGVIVQRNNALVELDFVYGKLGQRTRYTVRRSWSVRGRTVHEGLSLFQDGTRRSLTPEACQGFLNELIPIGVSDLFFFDGEKIAELAEDDTGHALGDAVQRLLGLDLVERLRNDLRVYMLRHQVKAASGRDADETAKLQQEYEGLLEEISQERAELEDAQRDLVVLIAQRDFLDAGLTERGGAWGTSKEVQRARAKELTDVLHRDERELREELAGAYPLSLASGLLSDAVEAAATGLNALSQAEANDLLESFAAALKADLDAAGGEVVDRALGEALQPTPESVSSSDFSLRALGRMEQTVGESIPAAESRVERLVRSITTAKDELDAVSLRIQQAPDEATLADDFDKLAALNERITEATSDVAVRRREVKSDYGRAVELARSLREKHKAISARRDLEQPLEYANGARQVLKDFGRLKAERKIQQLEQEFAAAFQALARKDDLVAGARIDPRNFTVRLLNREGRELQKAQLSAGEKQIYAVAMLEALARTSGRRLPVVIDTPLGRLDSHHRANLVTNYFPRASHQVILLSTDVEVDESFYRELSPSISHAFEIQYDAEEHASSLHEGYFWRNRMRMAG